MLPQLLAQIPADEQLHSVSADGAYDTKACHEAIASRQAAAIEAAKSMQSKAARKAPCPCGSGNKHCEATGTRIEADRDRVLRPVDCASRQGSAPS